MNAFALTLVFVGIFASTGVLYVRHRMAAPPDRGDLAAALDVGIARFVRAGTSGGLVVGVYKDGKTFIKGYGAMSNTMAAHPEAATVFQIGSISKLFTATVLQVLCDEGVVALDDTLDDLLGPAMPLSPAAREVTLRQLVTHTSGFPSIPKPLEAKAVEMMKGADPLLDPYSHLGPEYLFEYLATTEDKRAAGRFEYSNFGMGLLGHVLEIVTGRDYESLVIEKVLAPLAMDRTVITPNAEITGRLARGYTAAGVATPVWTFAALQGAGAWYSSVEDMLKYVRANIDEGSRMAGALENTRRPQPGGVTGLGWMQPGFLDRLFGNRAMVWHNGMVGGYAAYLAVDTQAKVGVVVLSNRAEDVTMPGMLLMRQVRTQSWSPGQAF